MPEETKKNDWMNVLIVDYEKEAASTKEFLKKHGLSEENIQTVESADEALDILIENDEVSEARDRIHMLLCNVVSGKEDSSSGTDLIKMIRHDVLNRPCVISTTPKAQKEEIEAIKELLRHHADLCLLKGDEFSEVGLIEAIRRTNKLTSYQADPRSEKDPPIQEEESSEGPIIVPGGDEACYYERLKDKNLPSLINNLSNQLVALFDVDGTLARPFIMGRFVEFLKDNSHFQELLRNLKPSSQRKKNREAMKNLFALIEKARKGTYEGPYQQMIKEMDNFYAEMLAGLSVRKVCAIGSSWSYEDQQIRKYQYAEPIIRLVRHLGMVPTLVTGMPAETLPGYKEGLAGIEERCYFLELHTTVKEGELVYVDQVKHHAGLSDKKGGAADHIIKNGNLVMCAFGDQDSDLDMMTRAMIHKGGAAGKGFYFMEKGSQESLDHIAHMKKGHSNEYNADHLLEIDKNKKIYAILEQIVSYLFIMESKFQYNPEYVREVLKDFQYTEYRNRLHALQYHPWGKPEENQARGERGGLFDFYKQEQDNAQSYLNRLNCSRNKFLICLA